MAEYKSPQSEPGMDRNVLLVFLLMAAVIFGTQLYMRKYAPPTPATSAHPAQPIQPPPPANVSAQAVTTPSSKLANVSGKQASSENQTVIENDLYRITFTNRGAQAKSWVLKKFFDEQGHPLDLVNSAAAAKYGDPLSLWTYDESLRNKLNSALYVPSSSSQSLTAPAEISFDYADSSLTVRKTFRFDQSYVVGVETSVFLNGAPQWAFPAWPSGFGDQTNLPAYAAGQFEYQFNNDTQHIPAKKISGGNTQPQPSSYNWVGASSNYFGAVFIPDKIDDVKVVTLHSAIDIVPDPTKPDETKPADIIGVAVGHPGTTSVRLFAGPKSVEVLDSVAVPTIVGANKDLRNMLNFGWFGAIARPLFAWKYIGLRWIHGYVHNWGWAIVIQTLVITLALLPLRITQMKSALKMQRVQPQAKAIQEKYKKYSMRDPRKQEMQKEIAALYKEHGVNPLGGCLPLVVQLPFLWAYYKMLGTAIDLRFAHWLWIRDLSSAEAFPFLLPIIMVVSMIIMQRMSPQPGVDPAQQRMMNIMMPAMMGFIFFRLAAGLNLYYAESNLIMIAQQAFMNRTRLGREMKEIAAKRARKKDK